MLLLFFACTPDDTGSKDTDTGTVDTDTGETAETDSAVDTETGTTETDSGTTETDSGTTETDSGTTETDTETTVETGYHPDDFDDSEIHGGQAKLQQDDCLSCHGEDLGGGSSGVSCDDCHDDGWRTNCTFCHGGTDNNTGAPPEDIDNSTTGISFPEHSAHVEETDLHVAFTCVQCHLTPEDPLTPGHFFVSDSTKGAAELNFAASISSAGSYATGTCSNLWCHGDGTGDNGVISSGDSVADCNACHDEAYLGGDHDEHLREGLGCEECHPDTALDDHTINDKSFHVDGSVELGLPAEISFDGSSCTGECHGEYHNGRGW